MDIIPNIYHFIYEIYNKENDIETYIFLCIKSVIEICNPDKIYFHYSFLPCGKLWDNIKDYLTLIKIIIPKNEDNKNILINFKNIFIYKILLEYGGIYIDSKSLIINPITNLLKYNFVKTINNEIVCSVKTIVIVILIISLLLCFLSFLSLYFIRKEKKKYKDKDEQANKSM